jgi:4,5-DOPA dioxygenase extradiol
MNALEDNEFSRAWIQVGRELPHPAAILCVSAHWQTRGTHVTSMETPPTIHDFGGFPLELFEYQYPAPGSPELAALTCGLVEKTKVEPDDSWGLDHGTWSVLCHMFPNATIPVIQLSLDATQAPEYHYALGQELRQLRQRGVLVIGSGNIVHNLRMAYFADQAYDWASEFDEIARIRIETGDHAALVNYPALGRAAQLSIPTNEHYLPLLYILATQAKDERLRFFSDRVTMGSLSMRSVWIG